MLPGKWDCRSASRTMTSRTRTPFNPAHETRDAEGAQSTLANWHWQNGGKEHLLRRGQRSASILPLVAAVPPVILHPAAPDIHVPVHQSPDPSPSPSHLFAVCHLRCCSIEHTLSVPLSLSLRVPSDSLRRPLLSCLPSLLPQSSYRGRRRSPAASPARDPVVIWPRIQQQRLNLPRTA